MLLTLAGGGRTHDRYTRAGMALTGTAVTGVGLWMLADGYLWWGVAFLILGAVQLLPLGLYYWSRARRIS